MKKLKRIFFIFPLLLFFLLWQLLLLLKPYPDFILPSPQQVFIRFLGVLQNGLLFYHAQVTLIEILIGLILGFSTAFSCGYFLTKFSLAEKILAPFIVGFQAIPILALAPLLIIWFGAGISSKILVCALTLFFPVLINTLVGFKNIDPHFPQLMRSLGASQWQTLVFLEIPSSLPIIFAGLKIGVALSVIGAVVGEFVGADRGLGFLINLASGLYDTPLRFTSFFTLSLIAVFLYKTVEWLEKKVIKWKV